MGKYIDKTKLEITNYNGLYKQLTKLALNVLSDLTFIFKFNNQFHKDKFETMIKDVTKLNKDYITNNDIKMFPHYNDSEIIEIASIYEELRIIIIKCYDYLKTRTSNDIVAYAIAEKDFLSLNKKIK